MIAGQCSWIDSMDRVGRDVFASSSSGSTESNTGAGAASADTLLSLDVVSGTDSTVCFSSGFKTFGADTF